MSKKKKKNYNCCDYELPPLNLDCDCDKYQAPRISYNELKRQSLITMQLYGAMKGAYCLN